LTERGTTPAGNALFINATKSSFKRRLLI
jgi:hypothetical protein